MWANYQSDFKEKIVIKDGIDYLFHYTTIEKLALILKNQTIRLNALCNMDDLQEGRSKDLRNIGRFFFVSSWTDEEDESIPMWNMYTTMDAGVRIGLPKNPFLRHQTKIDDLKKVFTSSIKVEGEGIQNLDTFLNLTDLIHKGVYSIQAWNGDILTQVNYTNEKDLLEPQIVSIEGDKISLNTTNIGKYKNTYWDFQKEWRYMMVFLPLSITDNPMAMNEQFNTIVNRMANDMQSVPFDYYDLSLSPDALKSLIITPSPKMTPGNRILLDSLTKQFNPNTKIIESALNGLI